MLRKTSARESTTERATLKRGALEFLESVEKELTSGTPSPMRMRESVREVVAAAKSDKTLPHMRQPENAFLYRYAVPIVFRQMQNVPGIGETEARQSLLSEFYRNLPGLCLATPARTQRHPFNKVIGMQPKEVVAQWAGTRGAALRQACPDFAFREPFPYKIVFDGKYFSEGSLAAAQIALATNIYQAFFYRGLPYVPARKASPAWDYDFACLLAYDASESGTLKQAWDDLAGEVKQGFWEGANVYVMIVRGKAL